MESDNKIHEIDFVLPLQNINSCHCGTRRQISIPLVDLLQFKNYSYTVFNLTSTRAFWVFYVLYIPDGLLI